MHRSVLRQSLCVLSFALALALSASVGAETLYEDNFERPDGPITEWTVAMGAASLIDGQAFVGPTAAEHWLWAGDPAAPVPANANDVSFSFTMEFLSFGSDATVGRHGGFAFCGTAATTRGDAAFSGYFVDWIDRTADRGVRLTRVDNGVQTGLVTGQGAGATLDPPFEWRIEVDDTNIRVFGDDVMLIDAQDDRYRAGFFGFWSWAGDQQIAWDDLLVEGELVLATACFDATPPTPSAGSDVFFDARCSSAEGNLVSWDWDFGDGSSDSGETVEHTFAFADSYTVTLTVEDDLGNSDSVSQLVVVSDTLLPFTDDFERAAGPVDGWTTYAGEWLITDAGELSTTTAGAENWLWAGDPPGLLMGDFVAEFEMDYLASPADGVGRHGGFMFFGGEPTIRWQTTGYFVDWIDRPADRGVRFTRCDGNNTLVLLVPGAPDSPAEPPALWRVEVEGPRIRVYGDNVLLIDVQDETYRSGHVGFWAYSNAQDMRFDNLVIDNEIDIDLTACIGPTSTLVTAMQTVTFDGTCSVAPDGIDITSYEWDFGDGNAASGPVVQHAYAFPDSYIVTLTVQAGPGEATAMRQVVVSEVTVDYADDFERADGAVDGWTVATGAWSLLGGELAAGPTGAEHWIWAGDPPLVAPGNSVFEFDYEFLALGSNVDVGRHGGFQFHCTRPSMRTGAGAFSGYFIDWIDRAADRGVRLTRVDNGVLALLVPGQGVDATVDPPIEWRVEVDGASIRVYGDGDLLVDYVDNTYRGGFFGFWTWAGDQDVRADDLVMTGDALTPCFDVTSGQALAGEPVSFDASCSTVLGGGGSVVSYEWDFGDGGSDSGATVDHSFEFADSYTVTLTVEDDSGSRRSLSSVVSVADNLLPFADCFDRPEGPVDGWTPFAGDWNITPDGTLSTLTAGAEHWLWAGSPPLYGSGDMVLEFQKEYFFDPMDGVGRHAGVMFYAQDPTIRWQTSGYTVWWIDRVDDFGVVVLRWDNGVLTFLNPGTFAAVAQPPSVWRVEVEGPTIRVVGDDVVLVEVEDDTYRSGFLGLWAYSNGQDVAFDSVRVGISDLPECGGGGGPTLLRGDANGDRATNISDAQYTLNFLFLGGPGYPCREAADTNGDGNANISDAQYTLNFLFLGGPPPPAPFPTCGEVDPDVDCATPSACP